MLVFGISQIILFFKIWGMTNDIAFIRKDIMIKNEEQFTIKHEEQCGENYTLSDKIAVGAIVVCKQTNERLKVTALSDDGRFVCAKDGVNIGEFTSDELCTWKDWLRRIY